MPKQEAYMRWKNGFTEEIARVITAKPTAPVKNFPMTYMWHTGPWYDIFDLQIKLIQDDIRRAKAEDKLIIYLSCPISSRGGGYSGTNVDVAKHVERSLLERWGEAFWILNPAQYQLESKAGTGLMNRHAKQLGINLDELLNIAGHPVGGDYMRMWTTVLVENDKDVGQRKVDQMLVNTGQYFDAFYFVGPQDVQSFFTHQGDTLTAGVQEYFARKYATDPDFRVNYSVPEIDWKELGPLTAANKRQYDLRDEWEGRRVDFLRYYSLRASANYSLGSHDEWLIFYNINKLRRYATIDRNKYMADGDVSIQLTGFFDGVQIDPASSENALSRGYSL